MYKRGSDKREKSENVKRDTIIKKKCFTCLICNMADFTRSQIANVTWTENVKMSYFCHIPIFTIVLRKKMINCLKL